MLNIHAIAAYLQARLTRNEEGATAVEYGLLVSLIAIVIIGAVTTFGETIQGVFNSVVSDLTP